MEIEPNSSMMQWRMILEGKSVGFHSGRDSPSVEIRGIKVAVSPPNCHRQFVL